MIQINDPKIDGLKDGAGNPIPATGRFSAGQSPDPRLSVDQANPTIHAGTGYPMCIPRTGDNATDVGGADPLCPQQNRPKPVTGHCPNFTDAAVVPLPASGDITQPAAAQAFCPEFVMPAPPQDTTTATPGPDARQQAPFEVGDFVNYAGTLVHSADGPDIVSAHTIEANVGIYTKPRSKPSYVARHPAASPPSSPVPSRSAPGSGRPRRRRACSATPRARSASPTATPASPATRPRRSPTPAPSRRPAVRAAWTTA
jgi:hypothetical protein